MSHGKKVKKISSDISNCVVFHFTVNCDCKKSRNKVISQGDPILRNIKFPHNNFTILQMNGHPKGSVSQHLFYHRKKYNVNNSNEKFILLSFTHVCQSHYETSSQFQHCSVFVF